MIEYLMYQENWFLFCFYQEKDSSKKIALFILLRFIKKKTLYNKILLEHHGDF